jgi:RNA polymerase sigma factor (TIGR02999 family)
VARVVAYTYRELHALAHSRVRRSPQNTLLDTTGLVHECYLRLVAVGNLQTADRGQFMAYAARVMRSIIVDAVRSRDASRHGGDQERVPLLTDVPDSRAGDAQQILAVSDALDSLRAMDERLVTIVELRYFAGLDNTEIADVLQISERTVRREWKKARALLHHELKE